MVARLASRALVKDAIVVAISADSADWEDSVCAWEVIRLFIVSIARAVCSV